jgi:tRNA-dihydrouridine synthase B
MIKFGNLEINTKIALAPLAGVSDIAFRTICREMGAGLTYTEMVSAKALVYKDKKTHSLLKLAEGESPVAVQIFGSDISCMAEAAPIAYEMSGADFIDINMGCPVGKIVKSGDGSALMKDPEKAGRIIEAVVKSVPCPVTVKFRKGWDKGNVNAVEFGKMAEQAGVSAIGVHGRTRTQMYSGKADWDIIREVKKAVNVPVSANGDIWSGEDAVKILKYTGADIALVARGSMGNPWIFREGAALLAGKEAPPRPSITEIADTAMRQFELAAEYKGEHIACLEARKHYSWYLRGISHSGYFKERIAKTTTLDELRDITAGIKRELR